MHGCSVCNRKTFLEILMPRFGKRSKQRLKGVDTKLVNVLNELVKIMDVTIIEGLRSQ